MADSEEPPFLVRLSLRMHLPIQPQWRPWAMREIEGRYGPDPSSEDRDVIIPPYVGMQPWADGVTATGGRIARRPMSVRKADEQYAAGVHADGSPASRGTPLVEPVAFFERIPERLWPWLPLAVIAATASIIAATVALGLALL